MSTSLPPETSTGIPLVIEADVARRMTERLQRAGLVIDCTTLSPAFRRALFSLQCQLATTPAIAPPRQSLIGFAYPNSGRSTGRG